jgi:hypothetical protein
MTSQDPNGVPIDRVHIGAINTEIGERLRATLIGNPTRLPPHLLRLAEQMDSVEFGTLPSRIQLR